MKIEESNLLFSFDSGYKAIKFDDTSFYRSSFNQMPGAKGVDIVADSEEMIHFIEIKNCLGHERENQWRTSINNSKIDSAPHNLDVDNRDSLDIEIVKKVTMSISCLYGAWTKAKQSEKALDLETYWRGIDNNRIQTDKKKIIVTLFLEGNFNSISKTRTKRMIMKRIQDSISKKLSWLNCKVFVVDSDTYNKKYFTVNVCGGTDYVSKRSFNHSV